MAWRLARSLEKLRAQINQAAPGRSKASDGTIGDLAHQQTKSDHNANKAGVVCGFDLTHDPKNGIDCNKILQALTAAKDGRVNYFIWNRGIYYRTNGFKREAYNGKNPHDKHMHTSVRNAGFQDAKYWDDAKEWDLGLVKAGLVERAIAAIVNYVTPAKPPALKVGSTGESVRELQKLLGVYADGDFGAFTEKAVRAFQKQAGLAVDGIAGPYTLEAIRKKVAPVDLFDRVMVWVFEDEGGVTISPDEPGGISVYGVSRTAYSEYRGRQFSIEEMKALTKDEARAFYRARFWNVIAADQPAPLRYAAFDWAINSGPKYVLEYLETAKTADALIDARLAYLKTRPNWKRYGKGWTNRLNSVRTRCNELENL